MTMIEEQVRRRWTPAEQEEIEWLIELFNGPTPMAAVMGIVGLQRSGKSLFMIWIGFKMRKYFGMPFVSNWHPRPAFGQYTYIDDEKFNEEQLKVVKITRQKEIKDIKKSTALESMWDNSGVALRKAILSLDEVYQNMDIRRPMDPVGIRYGYVIFQYGHYQCIMMLATPSLDLIDSKRFKKFVTHEVGCSYHANWQNTGKAVCTYRIYNRNTMKGYHLNIMPEKWAQMYDTNVPIGPRIGTLGLKKEKINKGV